MTLLSHKFDLFRVSQKHKVRAIVTFDTLR